MPRQTTTIKPAISLPPRWWMGRIAEVLDEPAMHAVTFEQLFHAGMDMLEDHIAQGGFLRPMLVDTIRKQKTIAILDFERAQAVAEQRDVKIGAVYRTAVELYLEWHEEHGMTQGKRLSSMRRMDKEIRVEPSMPRRVDYVMSLDSMPAVEHKQLLAQGVGIVEAMLERGEDIPPAPEPYVAHVYGVMEAEVERVKALCRANDVSQMDVWSAVVRERVLEIERSGAA